MENLEKRSWEMELRTLVAKLKQSGVNAKYECRTFYKAALPIYHTNTYTHNTTYSRETRQLAIFPSQRVA
jgi:hypothetical protein